MIAKRAFMVVSMVLLGSGLLWAGPAFAGTINVPGDQPTISDALAVAQAGDTIAVAASYDAIVQQEKLPIWVGTSNISIVCAAGALIEVPASHAGVVFQGVTGGLIQGCSFQSSPGANNNDNAGPITMGDIGVVVKESSGVTVDGNTIHNLLEGIRLFQATATTVSNNQVHDIGELTNFDPFSGNPNLLLGQRSGIGIFLEQSNANALSNNSVWNAGVGIFYYRSNGNTDTGGNYYANSSHGVNLNDSNNNTLSGLTVGGPLCVDGAGNAGNGGSGVVLSLSDGNTVQGSTVQCNAYHGIALYGSGALNASNVIQGNTVQDNGTVSLGETIQIYVGPGQKDEFSSPLFDGSFTPNDPFNTSPNDLRTEVNALKPKVTSLYSKVTELDVELSDLLSKFQGALGVVGELSTIQTDSATFANDVQLLDKKLFEIYIRKLIIFAFKVGPQPTDSTHTIGWTILPTYELNAVLNGDSGAPAGVEQDGIGDYNGDGTADINDVYDYAAANGLINTAVFKRQVFSAAQTPNPFNCSDAASLITGGNPTKYYYYDTVECEKQDFFDEVDKIKVKVDNLSKTTPALIDSTLKFALLQKLATMRGILQNVDAKLAQVLVGLYLADIALPTQGEKEACAVATDPNGCFGAWLQQGGFLGITAISTRIAEEISKVNTGSKTPHDIGFVSVVDAKLLVEFVIPIKESIFAQLITSGSVCPDGSTALISVCDWIQEFNREVPPPPFTFNGSGLIAKKESPDVKAIDLAILTTMVNKLVSSFSADTELTIRAQMLVDKYTAAALGVNSATIDASWIDQALSSLRQSLYNVIESNVVQMHLSNGNVCTFNGPSSSAFSHGCNVGIKVVSPLNVFVNNLIASDLDGNYAQTSKLDVGFVMQSDENLFIYNTIEWVDAGMIRGGDNQFEDLNHHFFFKKLAATKCGSFADPTSSVQVCVRPAEEMVVLEVVDTQITVNTPEVRVKHNRIALNFFDHEGVGIEIIDAESNQVDENVFFKNANGGVVLQEGSNAIGIQLEHNDFINGLSVVNHILSQVAQDASSNYALNSPTVGNVGPPAATAPFCAVNFESDQKFVTLDDTYDGSYGLSQGFFQGFFNAQNPTLPPNTTVASYPGANLLPSAKPRKCADLGLGGGGNKNAKVVATALDGQGNSNGVLDTAEILSAVAAWQAGTPINGVTIDTNLMLLLVAAWLNQTPIGSLSALTAPSPEAAQALAELMGTTADQPLAVQEVLTTPTAGAVSFTVLGQGVASIEVRVFTLSGELVYSSGEVAGNALRWDLLSNDGQPVANGVYLYVVTAHGFNGNSVTTKVNKLVVLR